MNPSFVVFPPRRYPAIPSSLLPPSGLVDLDLSGSTSFPGFRRGVLLTPPRRTEFPETIPEIIYSGKTLVRTFRARFRNSGTDIDERLRNPLRNRTFAPSVGIDRHKKQPTIVDTILDKSPHV